MNAFGITEAMSNSLWWSESLSQWKSYNFGSKVNWLVNFQLIRNSEPFTVLLRLFVENSLVVWNISHCVCCPFKYVFLWMKLDPNKWKIPRLNGWNVLKSIFVKVIWQGLPKLSHVEPKQTKEKINSKDWFKTEQQSYKIYSLGKVRGRQAIFVKIYSHFFLCQFPQNVLWCLKSLEINMPKEKEDLQIHKFYFFPSRGSSGAGWPGSQTDIVSVGIGLDLRERSAARSHCRCPRWGRDLLFSLTADMDKLFNEGGRSR